MLGQEVITVLDENRIAGRHNVRVDGSSLSSGIYFYRLQTKDFIDTKKLLLMK
ncbi:MAG: T9SS type A sorting domain-containing protein [Ignavibacteriales bacterium]|nr:T9SS type A sorting domain-containing protein [Ignavibacteriales bacterium]